MGGIQSCHKLNAMDVNHNPNIPHLWSSILDFICENHHQYNRTKQMKCTIQNTTRVNINNPKNSVKPKPKYPFSKSSEQRCDTQRSYKEGAPYHAAFEFDLVVRFIKRILFGVSKDFLHFQG